MNDELKDKVNQRYSDIARESTSCCSDSSCCPPGPVQQAKQVGYTREELEIIDQSKFADPQIDERLEGEITSFKVRAYR